MESSTKPSSSNSENLKDIQNANHRSNGKTKTSLSISTWFLVLNCIFFIIISGHFYVEYMKKPDMPQRLKVTMIDQFSYTVLQMAKLGEDLGFGHNLNNTRAVFSGAFYMQSALDFQLNIVITLLKGFERLCDFFHMDFCRHLAHHLTGDESLLDGLDIPTVDDVFDGVPVRLYQPISGSSPQPAIIFFHGAGVMGEIDVWDSLVRVCAANSNATVVYIEYRLAPEHGYPAPLEDCLKVTRWVLRHARQYNIDPDNVAMLGHSAGGVMAASAAHIIARDEAIHHKPKMLVLLNSLLQGLDLNQSSYTLNGPAFSGVLTKTLVAQFWVWYMGFDNDDLVELILQGKHLPDNFKQSDRFQQIVGRELLPDNFKSDSLDESNLSPMKLNVSDEIVDEILHLFLDPKFSPFMEENISPRHPPTLIVTGGYDILRDDGAMYATRLRRAGVKVWWRHFENSFHSCVAFWKGALKLEIGYQIHKETYEVVRDYLHNKKIVFQDRVYT